MALIGRKSAEKSVLPLDQNSSDKWDYFHINSVDKDSAGNYLISGKHVSALYKISSTDEESFRN